MANFQQPIARNYIKHNYKIPGHFQAGISTMIAFEKLPLLSIRRVPGLGESNPGTTEHHHDIVQKGLMVAPNWATSRAADKKIQSRNCLSCI